MSSTITTDGGMPPIAAASPYPWPFHGELDPQRVALVLLLDPSWRFEHASSESRDASLTALAETLGGVGALVVAVTWSPMRCATSRTALASGDGRSCARPRDRNVVGGERLVKSPAPSLEGLAAHVEVQAGGTDAFYSSPLDDVLRAHRRTDLVLAGWGLEGPVHSTMRSANDRGYECLLVPDASIPWSHDLQFAACEMVRFSGGIFGAYASTTDVLVAFSRATHLPTATPKTNRDI